MDTDAPTRVPDGGRSTTLGSAAGRGPAARPSPPQHGGAPLWPPRGCACGRIGCLANGEGARALARDIVANAPSANTFAGLCVQPVSYTHLRAHETSAHL
eukprot:2821482-Alexandrium_andersonii.AAC.1